MEYIWSGLSKYMLKQSRNEVGEDTSDCHEEGKSQLWYFLSSDMAVVSTILCKNTSRRGVAHQGAAIGEGQ